MEITELKDLKFGVYAPERIQESMKAQVQQDLVKFPRELGEEHPFDYKTCENTYKKFGFVKTAVDKHRDFIISAGFSVTSKEKKAETIINQLIEKTGLQLHIKQWIQEALIKGSGFMEVSVERDDVKLKVINSNDMYVMRDKTGTLLGYNQYVGGFNQFKINEVISFKPSDIAHLPIDIVGDSAYGIGVIFPALVQADYMTKGNKDMHMLMSRKANQPYHVKVGTIEEPATPADVNAVGERFIWLNNMHEWITDHKTEIKSIDLGNIGEKFKTILEWDETMLFYMLQVPGVIMGSAYQNEGIAKVQLDTFERRINSFQDTIEKVIEDQIFKPYLKAQGLEANVEIVWGLPSEESINLRLDKLTILVNNPFIQAPLKAMIERDIATTLGYPEEDIKLLLEPKQARELEKETELEVELPEVPGERSNQSEISNLIEDAWDWNNFNDMKLSEFVNLTEQTGFNYKDYKRAILSRTRKDEFTNLKAKTELDIQEGLLDETNVNKLRSVLHEGFRRDQTLGKVTENIRKNVILKDRLSEGKLVLPAEKRPEVIARTETVRLSNEGLVDVYKSNKLEEVRFLASLGDRTCPICEGLNGRIFKINELTVGDNQPPIHTGCRCVLIGIE